MANHQYPKTRKPTAVVKCPHCSHTGSARGLFQHVRMAHPTIAEKPATSTIITAHPLDIKGLGHVKDKVHRLDKKNQKDWKEALVIPLAIGIFHKIIENWNPNDLQSEFKNSSSIGSIDKKPKRKYYGE
jgi:hypothetical protein